MKKVISIMVLTLSLFLSVSCTSSTVSKNTGDTKGTISSTDSITIKGMDNGDIKLTLDELKKMEQVTKDVVAVDSAGKSTNYTAKGPLFNEVLKKYGKSQKDFKAIRIAAGDGYSLEIPEEVLKNRDIILAHELNGKPLDNKSKPVRIVVPEERAMYWVRNVSSIEILKSSAKIDVKKIVMIDSAVNTLKTSEFSYYGKMDKAIAIKDLFNKYPARENIDSIGIKAVDKLSKKEQKDIFEKANLKYTGDNSPALVSDDMPVGMWVKNMLCFTYAENVYMSVSAGQSYFNKTNIDGIDGILLKDMLKEAGVSSAGPFVLTASDGNKTEIEGSAGDSGIIYLNEKGEVCTYFKGLPKNTAIKGLFSIEVK